MLSILMTWLPRMQHLASLSGERNLSSILAKIDKLGMVNNKWIAKTQAKPSLPAGTFCSFAKLLSYLALRKVTKSHIFDQCYLLFRASSYHSEGSLQIFRV